MTDVEVMVNNKAFKWTAGGGLDGAAALELEGWIRALCKPYMAKARRLGLDARDLLHAGFVGALQAARSYLPDKNRTFLSWATYRITDELNKLCAPMIYAELGDSIEAGLSDGGASVEEIEKAIELEQLLKILPAKRRRILAEWAYGAYDSQKPAKKRSTRRLHINQAIHTIKKEIA